MYKPTNYIPYVDLVVEIVYPRTDIIAAATELFTDNNDIAVMSDNDIYHQYLYHRKRSRNEKLDNIKFVISDNAFRHPQSTNQKLIGTLQNVMKCLDPVLRFDRELIDFIAQALHEICANCETMGLVSYYATHQRKRIVDLFKYVNQSENIRLNIYYNYSQEEK